MISVVGGEKKSLYIKQDLMWWFCDAVGVKFKQHIEVRMWLRNSAEAFGSRFYIWSKNDFETC